MQQIADLEFSIAVLGWDKEVNLPPHSSAQRARQVATLTGMAHELSTSVTLGEMLENLSHKQDSLNPEARRNVQLSLKKFKKSKKLSKSFVERQSKVTSAAYDAWIKAREQKDYGIYRPHLQQIFELKRESAELFGYADHPYDALLDEYEPEYTTKQLDALFIDVKRQLVDFANDIRSKSDINTDFLHKFYPKDEQWNLGLALLKNIGYDFKIGRQDISTHPFTTSFGPQDVRLTTRIDEHNLAEMIWSCLHEGGHALYEQGLKNDQYGLPLGAAVSLGIHESQSRLWENNVGRSLPYWQAHYQTLQERFPANLGKVSLHDFYRGINKIGPGFIRTEADEVHYHFHVMIRYELEKAMIEGAVKADDLEALWNEKYKDYLGLNVQDPTQGILQDIHWAFGLVGYFPTYSLGSFYAAQFFEQAKKDMPNLSDQIAAGDHTALLAWLRENIHQYGQMYSADDLCKRVTGASLDFRYFMKYLEEKYGFIYAS